VSGVGKERYGTVSIETRGLMTQRHVTRHAILSRSCIRVGESTDAEGSSWSLVSDSDARGTVEHGPHHPAPG
jgi:hypothetical protein